MKKVINLLFTFIFVFFLQGCKVDKEEAPDFPEEIKQLFPENRNKLSFVSNKNDTLLLKITDLSYTTNWCHHEPKKVSFYVDFDIKIIDSLLIRGINYESENGKPSSYQLYQINNEGGIYINHILHSIDFIGNRLYRCEFHHLYFESSKINDINVSTDSVICLRNGCWDEYYKKGVGLYKMQNKEGVVWTLIE